jgi:hypothetical protein
MNYYTATKEQQDKMNEAGIDYDLTACLEYNPQPFQLEDVEKVLAVFTGEHDGTEWRWVLKLNKAASKKYDSKFVYLQGGCDYTGWDCRSSAWSNFCETAKQAAEFSKNNNGYEDETFKLGVYTKLIEQLKSKKNKTWREEKDQEFKNDLPKI